ncbi:MAG: SH3 domain-containing protein [Acidobacteria bacterium]|nr:SH3 domain-containing protein [Acidobacteriota bacterium]
MAVLLDTSACLAQTPAQERTFPQSKAVIEKALRTMQPSLSGHLPTLEGFAAESDRPLERFKRGYYQCVVGVTSTANGGSLVRVSAKLTAWDSEPDAARSGYRVLASNGRLESDVLNQLQEVLATATSRETLASSAVAPPLRHGDDQAPAINAPSATLSRAKDPLAASLSRMPKQKTAAPTTSNQPDNIRVEQLRSELKNLQEIQRNQAHPNNLVAVKAAGTPIVSEPRLDAKVLFYTTLEDEFEILDTTSDWVHVRISGLSRGWIRRSSVEMPANNDAATAMSASAKAGPEPFYITREETAPFPAEWEPLRGKTVKIISVQKTDERARQTAQAKLDFAISLLGEKYAEVAQSTPAVAGVLVIFDSADGGMMAATLPALKQWKAGTLSKDALWRQSYFDPPETFAYVSSN